MTQAPNPQEHRMEFVLLFDVTDGNPNGDPDAGNIPRWDPEDNRGLVTDVCLKRKVRNYAALRGQDIYIKERSVLQAVRGAVPDMLNLDERGEPVKGGGANTADQPAEKGGKGKKAAEKAKTGVDENRKRICAAFYDVRTFGAVMTTKQFNSGQVRGPVQMTFAKSIDKVAHLDATISRVAVEKPEDVKKETTFGRKHIIPYGLYRCHGFISPHFAQATGFDAADLDLFWDALKNMFDHDRSAARGFMAARKLVVFRHDSALGNAQAHKLLEMVEVIRKKKDEPRRFSDYEVKVGGKILDEKTPKGELEVPGTPKGVTVELKF